MPTVIHGRRGRDTAIAEGAAQPRFRSVHVDAAPWREGRTIRLVLPPGWGPWLLHWSCVGRVRRSTRVNAGRIATLLEAMMLSPARSMGPPRRQ